jgi:hypothetical protein
MTDTDRSEGATATLSEENVDADDSFVSNLLKPGSSLNPTFLAIVDGCFAFLLVVLLSLLAMTRSVHFVVLPLITLGLWASVKW